MKWDASVEVMLKYDVDLIESVFEWCLDTFGEDGFLLERIRLDPGKWSSSCEEVIRCTTSDSNAAMLILRWSSHISKP